MPPDSETLLAWPGALQPPFENSKNYDHLFSGWFEELKQQLQVSLAKTIQNGKLCTEGNTWKFTVTKLVFCLLRLIPSLNRKLERGPRRDGMSDTSGRMVCHFCDSYGGLSLPQVYCCPVSSSVKTSGVLFTDDVIFQRNKKGVFQILVLLESLAGLEATRNSLQGIDNKLLNHYLLAEEATFIFQAAEVTDVRTDIGNDIFRLATADEFAAT